MSATVSEPIQVPDEKASRIRLGIVRGLRTFALCLAAWIVVGLMFVGQDVTRRLYWDDPVPWSQAGFWTIRVVVSAAITPIILWLGSVLPIDRSTWVRRVPLHLFFSLCFGAIGTGLEAAVYTPLSSGWGPAHEWAQSLSHTWAVLLIFGFHHAVIAYWFILCIQAASRYYRKFQERERAALRLELHASELRAQVASAQLGALKMQLQPHFLFNTLNAIMGMVRLQDLRQAENALSRFSDLLRAVLDDLDTHEVPLERELTYLRLYLSIEQMRFPDRLNVQIEADSELLDAAVPHMALQPVVENAVRHGIGCRLGGGRIEVRVTKVDGRLRITVQDKGLGPRAAATAGRGLGLSNLRARLEQLYGADGELRIECTDAGATVTVSLPHRRHSVASNLAISVDGVNR
ncbi:MAG: signal transduction histidine kinase, LytS [Microvirga sp.]|nr:signal transduction histidine kinase, LytS [Microvirga sp.]